MKILKRLAHFCRLLEYFYCLKNVFWSKQLLSANVSSHRIHLSKRPDQLYLMDFDLTLSRSHLFFLQGIVPARLLKDIVDAKFGVDKSSELICSVQGLSIAIRTVEELHILKEIFVDEIYNAFPVQKAVIWDIGMNIGIASLYFASHHKTPVYGYEPLKKTYDLAVKNFRLNPEVSDFIQAFNFGIGGVDRREEVDYCLEWKGSVGLNGLSHFDKNKHAISREEILLRNAATIFDEIQNSNPSCPIIAKIDCEGGEYEIINSLSSTKKLELIDVIMMEWHGKGSLQLVTDLHNAGFTVFSFPLPDRRYGMIYAINTQSHHFDLHATLLPPSTEPMNVNEV